MRSRGIIALFELSLMLFIFLFCIALKLSTIGIILIAIVVVIGYVKKEIRFKTNIVAICFMALYMSYLIGSFWTNNPELAGKYIENKLSFLIFPLLFSIEFKKGEFSFRIPIMGLAFGIVISSMYGIWNAYFNCYTTMDTLLCFSASYLSPIHHPSYFAAMHFLSILLVWYGYRKGFKGFNRYAVYSYISFSIIFQGFLMSLAGILFLVLVLAIVFLRFIYLKLNRLKFYSLILLFVVVSFFGFRYTPYLNEEIQQSYSELSIFFKSPSSYVQAQKYPFSGNATRLSMWIVSSEVLIEHPLGVGTGNVDYFLTEKLKSLNQPEFAALEYNPHNQYLQTGIEIGILGLVFLVGIIVFGIRKGIQFKNWILVLLVSNLAFNMLFESVFQRQSGIVFYCFWICLLVAFNERNSPIFNEQKDDKK